MHFDWNILHNSYLIHKLTHSNECYLIISIEVSIRSEKISSCYMKFTVIFIYQRLHFAIEIIPILHFKIAVVFLFVCSSMFTEVSASRILWCKKQTKHRILTKFTALLSSYSRLSWNIIILSDLCFTFWI